MKKSFENERKKWTENKNHLVRKIDEKNIKILDLEEQSRRLEEEVGNLYRDLREEKAAKRLLIADLNGRKAADEGKTKTEKTEVDPVHMKIALDQVELYPFKWQFLILTDIGENVQKWTRVFSTRR